MLNIRDNAARAMLFTQDMFYEQFRLDTRSFYAVTRALEIISEASRRLSAGLKARHPQMPWKDMAGAGSIYRHDYEDVIERRVWYTVQEAMPSLLKVVEAELANKEGQL